MSAPTAQEWATVRAVFNRAFASNLHFAIASVTEDGRPWVTPIGSVLLTEPGRGIYFEEFTQRLAKHATRDGRISILAVDSRKRFWLRSLLQGRFATAPGVRLEANVLGPRREATEQERARWLRRVRMFRGTRGHAFLWQRLGHVRDFEVTAIAPIRLGQMTTGTG